MTQEKSKEILKNIYEAIANKNDFLTIQFCQELIKEDPLNYLALVVLGVSFQNSNKAQAYNFLRKAADSFSDPTEALWQLTKCAPLKELPEIYEVIISVDPENYRHCHEKLAELGLFNPKLRSECIKILKHEEESADTIMRWRSSQLSLVKIFSFQENLTDDDEELFRECLESVMADKINPQYRLECFKMYSSLLYKKRDYEKILAQADSMVALYPEDSSAFEWICRIFCETYKTDPSLMSCLSMQIDWYSDQLKQLNQDSIEVLLVDAIRAMDEDQVPLARNLLRTILQTEPNKVFALELLALAEMRIGAYGRALQVIKSLGWNDERYGICLSYCKDSEDLNEAIKILSAQEQTEEVLDALARCFVRLDEKEQLDKMDLPPLLQIRHKFAPQEGLDALDKLGNEKSFETLMERGRLNFALENYNNSLAYLVEASRMKSYRAECFFRLGIVYMALGINDRGLESWNVGKELNPDYEEVDVYFKKFLDAHPVETWLGREKEREAELPIQCTSTPHKRDSPVQMMPSWSDSNLFSNTRMQTLMLPEKDKFSSTASRLSTRDKEKNGDQTLCEKMAQRNSHRRVDPDQEEQRTFIRPTNYPDSLIAFNKASQTVLSCSPETPTKQMTLKRGSCHLTPPQNALKKLKPISFCFSSVTLIESPGREECLTVAVLPEHYPRSKLIAEEIADLEDAILEEISTGGESKLQFEGSEFKSGLLLVHCTNSRAAEWLIRAVSGLRNWKGQELTACLEDHILTLQLPRSSGQTLEKTMSLIESQNNGLNTKVWMVLEFQDVGKDQILTIVVDNDSFEAIRRQGNGIHYKLGKVSVESGLKSPGIEKPSVVERFSVSCDSWRPVREIT